MEVYHRNISPPWNILFLYHKGEFFRSCFSHGLYSSTMTVCMLKLGNPGAAQSLRWAGLAAPVLFCRSGGFLVFSLCQKTGEAAGISQERLTAAATVGTLTSRGKGGQVGECSSTFPSDSIQQGFCQNVLPALG